MPAIAETHSETFVDAESEDGYLLEGADHVYRGREEVVADRLADWIDALGRRHAGRGARTAPRS